MGLFFRKRTFEEPAFGRWNYYRKSWWAAFDLPGHEGVVEISVFGTKLGPDPVGLALAIELPVRYGELVEGIQAELFAHYAPALELMQAGELPQGEVPVIDWAGGVWPHVNLEEVRIRGDGGRQSPWIEIVYSTAWDIEHALGAQVQDWRVVGLSGSV